ncbi:MAG: PQQ-binding-like beta-propeller repeat protein [Acidobacteria bacterium]|nr:PQQ-binding-like beta-propeller repeat protein [Acidobacteriota bacterium]MYJ05419.1 PQQ-binding-like beta-propeller repeat protein [Acidobacteriota bacterium]
MARHPSCRNRKGRGVLYATGSLVRLDLGEELTMRQHRQTHIALPLAIAIAALAAVPLAGQFGGGFELTVTPDRLINAQNEPQNWLLMNGDYGSQRYSKLDQINRDNVGNLRMVWALALGGMLGTGANGPENEVNPLIDNGFMYTTDGWGTVYKIDARNHDFAKFIWTTDPGVDQEDNRPRTRGIALWEDKVIQNLQDGRVLAMDRDDGEILWDVEVAGFTEFGRRERFLTAPLVADGKVLVQNGAGDGGTRGWVAALDVNTGEELWRWYTVPAPGEPGSETWKDDHNAWKTGGGGVWQTGSYDPERNLYIFGTGNPYPIYDPEFRPGDNLYTNSAVALDVATGERRWHFQYTPNDSWDYDEVGVHMLYDTEVDGEMRNVVAHFARNGFFYSLDRDTGEFIKGHQYVNELNWTAGLNPETGMPLEYDPELDIQIYNEEARALRADRDEMKRACPTWHGGVAHQPTAYNPEKGIAYGVGTEGCFSQTGAAVASAGPEGNIDNEASERREYTSDLYYGSVTAVHVDTHEVIAKAVTEIEVRSGAIVTAGGLVFSALQDGWVVAYNDETLQELWRFNVGTPLKGAPVTYSIGPRQYLAVQTSGRHLHPVNFDNLQTSSYLFVFALDE